MNQLAQIKLYPDDGLRLFGILGLEGGSSDTAPNIFQSFLSGAIGLMTVIAAIWFVFVFITGAISMIGAGGDKTALESARKKIFSGLIGLIVVVSAVFIIDLIGKLIGFDLILSPAGFIQNFSF